MVSVIFLFDPFLTHLPNDFRSFIWSLLTLFPLAWISLLDLSSSSIQPTENNSGSFPRFPRLWLPSS